MDRTRSSPTSRRTLLKACTALVVAVTVPVAVGTPAFAAAPASPAVTFTNPLAEQRADPHIVKHTDGYYYFTATVPEYDRIVLRRATTLQGLATAAETAIWRKHSSGEMGAHIWAPEIHYIDGKWYIYFAAGGTDDVWAIRMYVLENATANPLGGAWTEKGRIAPPRDTFSLDATTFVDNGIRYLTWAQNDPAVGTGTNLYLAKMTNPWTITGTPVRIAGPRWPGRPSGTRVNEGPAVIQRNGKVFMTFSASATDANYCLGLLTAVGLGRPAEPLLVDEERQTRSSRATRRPASTARPQLLHRLRGRQERHPRLPRPQLQGHRRRPAQRPEPAHPAPEALLERRRHAELRHPGGGRRHPGPLSSHNVPDRYLRHWDYRAQLEPNVTKLADSQFRIVPRPGRLRTVSLESANFPGYYLRHRQRRGVGGARATARRSSTATPASSAGPARRRRRGVVRVVQRAGPLPTPLQRPDPTPAAEHLPGRAGRDLLHRVERRRCAPTSSSHPAETRNEWPPPSPDGDSSRPHCSPRRPRRSRTRREAARPPPRRCPRPPPGRSGRSSSRT